MKTKRFKTRQRGMISCRGTGKKCMSDHEKEKKRKQKEIDRARTKAALEKRKTAKKKE